MTAIATTLTDVDRLGLELKGVEASMGALVESATQKNRKQRHELSDRTVELKAEIKRAAASADKAEKAEAHKKHSEDVRALVSLGDKLLEPIGTLRKAADAFAEALGEVRPLLRQFHGGAHALGVTVPPRFVTGSFIEWELEAVLNRAWPQLFSRPRAPQLRQSNVGDLVTRSVATAIEAARRTLNEEGTP